MEHQVPRYRVAAIELIYLSMKKHESPMPVLVHYQGQVTYHVLDVENEWLLSKFKPFDKNKLLHTVHQVAVRRPANCAAAATTIDGVWGTVVRYLGSGPEAMQRDEVLYHASALGHTIG